MPLNRGLQDFIDSEPELEDFEGFYMQAFWRLVTERRGGNCIPYSEIVKYAGQFGLDSAMIETLPEIIWGLEKVYSDWAEAEAKRKRQNEKREK